MTPTPATARPDLPELPLEAWEPTKTTLHLWAQIVGKVKLAATAPRNHWWNVPLYLDVRGLTTRRLPARCGRRHPRGSLRGANDHPVPRRHHPFPAFYSYTAPEPPGLADQPLHPEAAAWRQVRGGSMALLGYDQLRAAHDPRSTLLGFLQSAYDAGVRTAGWDRQELTSSFCPSAAELQALYQRVTAPSGTLRPSTNSTGKPPSARA
jgi:hypothetical protein